MSNRQNIKDKIKELLQAHLIDDLPDDAFGNKTIYAALKFDLEGQSPVVCVVPAGTEHRALTPKGLYPIHAIDIHIFIKYASDADDWTEEDADNELGDLAEKIGGFVAVNRVGTAWKALKYRGGSTVGLEEDIAGTSYLHEIIPLEAWN